MLAFIILATVVRSLLLRRRIVHQELIRAHHVGFLSCELRRGVLLATHREIDGTKSFPFPLEARTLVWRIAGLPWRIQCQRVGLPNDVADRVDSVGPLQFDGLFSAAFRCSAPPPALFGPGSTGLVR
jgi:hypothetical protein